MVNLILMYTLTVAMYVFAKVEYETDWFISYVFACYTILTLIAIIES